MAAPAAVSSMPFPSSKTESKRKEDIRQADITAAHVVADAVRTSLGPKGMDKMMSTANGATIQISGLWQQGTAPPMLVVVAGALLKQCLILLSTGIHPTVDHLRLNCRGSWVLHEMEGFCVKSFAEALEVIPYTLAENAGLNPIAMEGFFVKSFAELRNRTLIPASPTSWKRTSCSLCLSVPVPSHWPPNVCA